MAVLEITDANFDEQVLQSDQPVLVDFWAPYCMPCRQMLPMIEQLAEENDGSAKVAKVNVQDNTSVALKYGVQNIPMLMVVQNGEVVQRWIGMQSKEVLQEALDAAKPA